MTDRQRDLFLFQWSKRRAPGGARIALRGAVIGALGGIVFVTILLRAGAAEGELAYDFAEEIVATLELFAMSVPVFAAMGWAGARRIWRSNESMYQALLAAGARVPDAPPELQLAERGPMIAVLITVVVIAGFIGYLVWAASTGRL